VGVKLVRKKGLLLSIKRKFVWWKSEGDYAGYAPRVLGRSVHSEPSVGIAIRTHRGDEEKRGNRAVGMEEGDVGVAAPGRRRRSRRARRCRRGGGRG